MKRLFVLFLLFAMSFSMPPAGKEMKKYLKETPILDFSSPPLFRLSTTMAVKIKNEKVRTLEVYKFVRDSILFGFNENDNIPASKVILEGKGYSNTKANLLMAALRNEDVPCRIHFFKVTKKLYRGLLPKSLYSLLPDKLIHSWVEVYLDGKWLAMEGVVLDRKYLKAVQKLVGKCGPFTGYGVAVDDLCNINIKWNLRDTFIQHRAIVEDLGVYATPDEFYEKYGTNFNGLTGLIYRKLIMKKLNENIEKIRRGIYKK